MRFLQTEHVKSGTHKKDGNATLTNGTHKKDGNVTYKRNI